MLGTHSFILPTNMPDSEYSAVVPSLDTQKVIKRMKKRKVICSCSFIISVLEAIAYQTPGVQSTFWVTPEKSCNVPGVA